MGLSSYQPAEGSSSSTVINSLFTWHKYVISAAPENVLFNFQIFNALLSLIIPDLKKQTFIDYKKHGLLVLCDFDFFFTRIENKHHKTKTKNSALCVKDADNLKLWLRKL